MSNNTNEPSRRALRDVSILFFTCQRNALYGTSRISAVSMAQINNVCDCLVRILPLDPQNFAQDAPGLLEVKTNLEALAPDGFNLTTTKLKPVYASFQNWLNMFDPAMSTPVADGPVDALAEDVMTNNQYNRRMLRQLQELSTTFRRRGYQLASDNEIDRSNFLMVATPFRQSIEVFAAQLERDIVAVNIRDNTEMRDVIIENLKNASGAEFFPAVDAAVSFIDKRLRTA
jgi:hypothetical protein